MNPNALTILWWNTSLAPRAKNRATPEQQDTACQIINLFIREKIDFIALGEVSETNAKYFKSNLDLTGYELKSGISKAGRSTFDTCYLYNEKKMFINDFSDITSNKGDSKLRVAQQLTITAVTIEPKIHIFVSHWPSRLWCHKKHVNRHHLGIRLRDSIDKVIDESGENACPHIILLGDYNDEPFDKSLSDHVMATRDRKLVFMRSHLFYNPFWNRLGPNRNEPYLCGSYYYKGGKITKWHIFDQIMFSRAFIEGNDWFLHESKVDFFKPSFLIELITNPKEIFDHLPVVATIERKGDKND